MKKLRTFVIILMIALLFTSCSNGANNVNVVGTPLAQKQLENFDYDYELKKDFADFDNIVDFLDGLNNSEFKELYFKALSLVQLADTFRFPVSDNVDTDNKAYIEVKKDENDYLHTYYETGYTYDSFYNTYCSVFTEETAQKIIDRFPVFYEYNGELWYVQGSSSGDPREVLREYEIVSQTDTVFEFRRISYQNDDEHADEEEYDPERRDEYIKEYIDFKFVLTESGWRVEKFLNAQDYDKIMMFY